MDSFIVFIIVFVFVSFNDRIYYINKLSTVCSKLTGFLQKKARQISWKCFELEEVKTIFDNSSTPLATSKSFRGEEEVTDCNPVHLTGTSAIAFSKANATGFTGQQSQQPTCRALLVVGNGEGRATCKFEVIWRPGIYANQQ